MPSSALVSMNLTLNTKTTTSPFFDLVFIFVPFHLSRVTTESSSSIHSVWAIMGLSTPNEVAPPYEELYSQQPSNPLTGVRHPCTIRLYPPHPSVPARPHAFSIPPLFLGLQPYLRAVHPRRQHRGTRSRARRPPARCSTTCHRTESTPTRIQQPAARSLRGM